MKSEELRIQIFLIETEHPLPTTIQLPRIQHVLCTTTTSHYHISLRYQDPVAFTELLEFGVILLLEFSEFLPALAVEFIHRFRDIDELEPLLEEYPPQIGQLRGDGEVLVRSGKDSASPVEGGATTRAAESLPRNTVVRLISKLHELGAKNVILTGVSFNDTELGSAISDGKSIVYDFNPRLTRMSHGTGDVFASVFAGAVMRGRTAAEAAALAADIVCSAIKATDDDHWYGVSFEKTIPELVSKLG